MRLSRIVLLFALAALTSPIGLGSASAQEAEAPEVELPTEIPPEIELTEVEPPTQDPPTAWRPPALGTDDRDWILMSSGEWISGNIEYMRDESLEFDSDDLDMLTLDWEDVHGLYAPTHNRYVLENDDVLSGPAEITEGILAVQTEAGLVQVPASTLLAILEGRPRERNRWSVDITLGLTSVIGNSEQSTVSMFTGFIREDPDTRLGLTYTGALGRSNGFQTVNNHWGTARFDWFVTRRFFVTVATGTVGTDEFRNLALQATAGSGVGYALVDTSRVDWDVSLVGAYVYTRYDSVEAGANNPAQGGAVVPATKLDIEVTSDIDTGATFAAVLVVNNFDLTFYRTTGYVKFEVTDILDLDFSVSWDRQRQPVATEGGETPKKDTVQMVAGLGVSF